MLGRWRSQPYPQCVHSTYTACISLFTCKITHVTVSVRKGQGVVESSVHNSVELCSFFEAVNHNLSCY